MKRLLSIVLVLLTILTMSSTTLIHVIALSPESTDAQLIGYGFNVTAGKPLSKGNLQYVYPILDTSNPELFEKIHVVDIQETKAQNVVAESAVELAEYVGSSYAGGIEGKIAVATVDINAQFDKSQTISNATSERYEMYYQQVLRRQVIIQMDDVELRDYLSEKFKRELYSVDSEEKAEMLFQKYGTHLLTGYTLGGRMDITNYMVTSDSSNDLSTNVDLKTKIGAAVACIDAGINFSISQQYASHENTATQKSTYDFSCIGGESVTGLTLDQLFTYNSSMVDGNGNYVYDRWVRSINEGKNLDIIGIASGGQAIPIWCFLDTNSESMAIKNCLISAYVKLCGDKYAEYCNQYPYLYSSVSSEGESSEGVYGVIENYYTSFDISNDDLIINGPYQLGEDDGNIYVPQGSTVYLDAFDSIYPGRKQWKILSGNANVEEIDAINGIFKATGSAGSDFTVAICDEDIELDRVNVKIEKKAFSGGIGTQDNPFLISTPDDMQELLSNGMYFNNPDNYYKLVNNIDISEIKINTAMDSTYCFRGVFDGNYCILSGFTANSDNYVTKSGLGKQIYIGLFGYNAGVIKNLTVSNCSFKFNDESKTYSDIMFGGVLAGINTGRISNCIVENSEVYIKKTAKNDNTSENDHKYQIGSGGLVGRLVGSIYNSGVVNCKDVVALANLTKTDNQYIGLSSAGGLVGYMEHDAYIEGCFVHFSHSGENISRVMAQVRGESNDNSYKTKGFSYAGGLVGWADLNKASTNKAAIFYCVVDAPTELLAGLQYCSDANNEHERRAGVVIGKNTAIAEVNFKGNVAATHRASKIIETDSNYANLFIKDPEDVAGDKTLSFGCNSVSYSSFDASFDNQVARLETKDGWVANENGKAIRGSAALKAVNLSAESKTKFYFGEDWTPLDMKLSLTNMNDDEINSTSFCANIADYNVNKNQHKNTANPSYPANIVIKVGNVEYSHSVEITKIDIVALMAEDNSEDALYVNDKYDASTRNIKITAVLANDERIDFYGEKDSRVNYLNEECRISNDKLVLGENKITVNYGKLSNYFVVVAEDNPVVSISVKQEPTMTYYSVGDIFTPDGMLIEATYKNGASMIVDNSELEIIGSSISEGENTIILSYGDYKTAVVTVVGRSMPKLDASVVKYDVNCNGIIDKQDAVDVLLYIHFEIQNIKASGDVNGDGKVTTDDAIEIQTYINQ